MYDVRAGATPPSSRPAPSPALDMNPADWMDLIAAGLAGWAVIQAQREAAAEAEAALVPCPIPVPVEEGGDEG